MINDMKQLPIIYTNDYAFAIDSKNRLVDIGKLCCHKSQSHIDKFSNDEFIVVQSNENNQVSIAEHWGEIIAYYPQTNQAKELDLPLLPNPFESEYNANQIIEMLLNVCKSSYPLFEDWIEYKEAMKYQTQSQSKQFSLDDIKKAIQMARDLRTLFPSNDYKYDEDEIIQSLSIQKRPKWFIPEIIIINQDYRFDKGQREELKTITNSEGKLELVGTYKYKL